MFLTSHGTCTSRCRKSCWSIRWETLPDVPGTSLTIHLGLLSLTSIYSTTGSGHSTVLLLSWPKCPKHANEVDKINKDKPWSKMSKRTDRHFYAWQSMTRSEVQHQNTSLSSDVKWGCVPPNDTPPGVIDIAHVKVEVTQQDKGVPSRSALLAPCMDSKSVGNLNCCTCTGTTRMPTAAWHCSTGPQKCLLLRRLVPEPKLCI